MRRPRRHSRKRCTKSMLWRSRLQGHLTRGSQTRFSTAHNGIWKSVWNDYRTSSIVPPDCECWDPGYGFQDSWVSAESDCILFDEFAFEAEEYLLVTGENELYSRMFFIYFIWSSMVKASSMWKERLVVIRCFLPVVCNMRMRFRLWSRTISGMPRWLYVPFRVVDIGIIELWIRFGLLHCEERSRRAGNCSIPSWLGSRWMNWMQVHRVALPMSFFDIWK